MEVSLGSYVLHHAGQTTNRDTLVVLRSAKGKKEKVVVGDSSGVVSCVAIKKGQPQVVFQTAPGKHPATAMCTGGSNQDRIYVAYGQTIQGLRKKGGEFFRFNTSLNEDIASIFVDGQTIWTSCEYIINVFEKNVDAHFYMAPDKINHYCAARLGGPSFDSILGCQDKNVRVVRNSDLLMEQEVEGPVSAVCLLKGLAPLDGSSSGGGGGGGAGAGGFAAGVGRQDGFQQLGYGTDDGHVGQLLVDPGVAGMAGSASLKPGWSLSKGASQAAINTLLSVDVSLDGVQDLVIGRDDGTLEVFSFGSVFPEPTSVFRKELAESITAVVPGNVLSLETMDMVLSTYSGKVIVYTHGLTSDTAPIKAREGAANNNTKRQTSSGGDEDLNEIESKETEEGIMALREEIAQLQSQIALEREKYSQLSHDVIAVEKQFDIKMSFKLIPSEACYLLTLEIPIPIDVVCLQSNVPVMLLDVDGNNAMLSITPITEGNQDGNKLLATYRCQDSTHRIEIKVRTVEGQHGIVQAYVMPKMQPKTCQRAQSHIKPLSLHEKVHLAAIENEFKERAINTLTLTGDFSAAQVHGWVASCLPGTSARMVGDIETVAYRSTFLNTILKAEYQAGRAVFSSDSMTAISILKEVISKAATSKRVNIDIQLDLDDQSVIGFLNLLRPSLDHHFALQKQADLIDPLREIRTQEDDQVHFLAPKYRDILERSEDIQAQIQRAPKELEFLKGIVTDLLVDVHKLKGRHIHSKVGALMDVLNDYSFERLVKVFQDDSDGVVSQ